MNTNPIRRDTAKMLAAYVKNRGLDQPLVAMPDESNVARMLYADLKDAGIRRIDNQGRQVDFHALRGTLATQLHMQGAPAKVVQELLGHASPVTTLRHYTTASLAEQAKALESLPSLDTTTAARGRRKAKGAL